MSWSAIRQGVGAFCMVGLVALVGCGDDDGSDDGAGGSGNASSTGGSGAMGGDASSGGDGGMGSDPGTIPQVADDAGDFTTLLAAVEAADLGDTLSGPGPFTVFAPTDDAFAKIPSDDLNAILEDKELLTSILTYHVVSGEVPAADVVTLDSATTVQGEDVSIEVVEGDVILNGYATVTATDIDASNGIIHVIDTVLLPPSIVD